MEAELAALTKKLREAEPLSRDVARERYKAALVEAWPKLQQGQTVGKATNGLSILNQPEADFRTELKATDNDLARQIQIVNEALDLWLARGETPPPYYPWRIAVILGKAKRKVEEMAFLSAWCEHFGAVPGGRYEALAARAAKLGL